MRDSVSNITHIHILATEGLHTSQKYVPTIPIVRFHLNFKNFTKMAAFTFCLFAYTFTKSNERAMC